MIMGTLKKIFFAYCITCSLLIVPAVVHAVNIGDPFPLFSKQNTLSAEECSYLRIEPGKDFSLNDIGYDVTIIEFLNVYCHTCRQQVQIFNEFYNTLKNDKELSGRACIIGIAVGNSEEEIRDFKKNFGAAYPILPDTNKAIFNMTGNVQGTPHTYILRKEEQRFIIDYHAGGVSSPDRYLATVRFALRGTFTGTEIGNKVADYSFKTGDSIQESKSFLGKPVILYFLVKKTYPVAIDTRNRNNQIKILHDIRLKFPEVTVVAFEGKDVGLPQAIAGPSFFIARKTASDALAAFRTAESPAVYFINGYGRISFKGEGITLYNAETIIQGKEYKPAPVLKENEVIALIEKNINGTGAKAEGTEKEILENGKTVYITALAPRRDGIYLFSVLESRPSLCDVCHDSHFIYIVDQEGVFRDFIPVQLTKLGNLQWTDDDVKKIKSQIAGKSIFNDFAYSPKADAVTSATMSSSLIYEAFNDAKTVFGNFKAYKFRYEFWKQACFDNICEIKKIVKTMQEKNKDVQLDEAVLAKIVSENKKLACPLDGTLVVLSDTILCSVHGLHKQDCSK